MIHRIQFRLLAAFLLVIVVAMATIMLFVLPAAEQQIDAYAQRTGRLQLARMQHWLLGYYSARGSWSGVQPFIEEMGVLYGQWVVLAQEDGTVIADSRSLLFGQPFTEDWTEVSLRDGGQEPERIIGVLYVSAESGIDEAFARALRDSLGVYLALGALLALAVALVLTVILSRAISAPVQQLVESARKAGGGDLSVRVSVPDHGELGQLAESFNAMICDLERSAELRRDLVADTAHELRTPLSNISGYLEALRDGIVDPQDALSSVEEDVGLLSRLVDDLQELAMAEAGTLQLNRQSEDLAVLIERSMNSVQARAEAQQVTMKLSLPDGLPPIWVDFQRITQVLHNLLVNALTHTEAGNRITVAAENQGRFIEVRVSDTGEGIPHRDRVKVFERFYRVDRSRNRATGGIGLGLTISKHLIESHGGSIRVEPNEPKGSVFVFTVPASAPSPQPLEGSPEQGAY